MTIHDLKHLPLSVMLKGLAALPWPVLYAVSGAVCFVMARLWGYRRRIVETNLRVAYPDMTDKQLRDTTRRFYRNFADSVLETAKTARIKPEEIMRRMTFNPADIEMIDRHIDAGRPVVAYFSHCFNWEWASSMPLWSRHREDKAVFCQIYRPLRNKWFDRWMLALRGRFGARSLPKKTAFLDLLRLRHDGKVSVTGFMSDQHPSAGDPGHLMMFLNHPTAIISGTETLARRMDAAVVYWDMSKTSRGHYHIDMVPLTDTPKELPEGELTRRYARALETTINRDPAIWLWSHNRWKRPVTLPAQPETT